MVTQVELGTYFNVNGRTVLGGSGGSRLDTQALIEALAAGKRIPATRLEDTIKLNAKKSSALLELSNLINSFREAANFLRNPPGVSNAASNAFKYAQSTVTSNTSTSGSSYLSIGVSPGAPLQSYTINEISSLAKATRQKTETISVADTSTSIVSLTPSTDEFKAGTFTLNGVDITLNVGDSLSAVAAKFNAVKNTTGISVSIIKVATGEYQLSFSGTQTGTANDFDFNNADPAGTLVDASGVFDEITITQDPEDEAADAIFTLNGVEITRSSNSITDVIEGVTFNLLQTTPALTELTVEITPDTQIAKGAVINLLNAYNDIRIFAAKQQEVNTDGTFASTAVLANNSALRSIMSSLSSHFSAISTRMLTGDPPKPAVSFIDLPASDDAPIVRNVLTLDEEALDTILESDFEEVRTAFEFDFISDNPGLRVFSRTNATTATEFSLLVNPFATQTTSAFTVNLADSIVAASPTAGMLTAGTVTINGQNVVLTAGMTAAQVEAAFDAAAAQTGVAAAVTGVDGSFQLVFTSTITGGTINFNLTSDGVDPTGVFDEISITATSVFEATYDTEGGPVTVAFDAVLGTSGISYTLTGPAGTPFEGLKLIYGGTSSSLSNVTIAQGFADKAYNTSNDALDTTNGGIQVELDALAASDSKLTEQIEKINAQVVLFREQLLIKFTALEQAISRINTLLQALDAQDQARRNSR